MEYVLGFRFFCVGLKEAFQR
jgi:hypothetical protein